MVQTLTNNEYQIPLIYIRTYIYIEKLLYVNDVRKK